MQPRGNLSGGRLKERETTREKRTRQAGAGVGGGWETVLGGQASSDSRDNYGVRDIITALLPG